ALELDGNSNFYGSHNLTFSGNGVVDGGRTLTILDMRQTITLAGNITEGIFGQQNMAKTGHGTLVISGVVSNNGTWAVNDGGGTLILSGVNGSLPGTSSISVGRGASLVLDDSGPVNNNRLPDLFGVTLNGGTLDVKGNANQTVNETIGIVSLG